MKTTKSNHQSGPNDSQQSGSESSSSSVSPARCKVYYDGLCVVCDREISHYKKMRGAHRIDFIDIFSADFDAAKEGLDPKQIHIEMHARDEYGNIVVGVSAFQLIWSKLDSLTWLARITKPRVVRVGLELGYKAFVKIRPMLPRKACETSPLCEIR